MQTRILEDAKSTAYTDWTLTDMRTNWTLNIPPLMSYTIIWRKVFLISPFSSYKPSSWEVKRYIVRQLVLICSDAKLWSYGKLVITLRVCYLQTIASSSFNWGSYQPMDRQVLGRSHDMTAAKLRGLRLFRSMDKPTIVPVTNQASPTNGQTTLSEKILLTPHAKASMACESWLFNEVVQGSQKT